MKPGRSLRVALAFATAVGPLAVACSLALDFGGIDDGVRDAAPDGAQQGDGSPVPPPGDAQNDTSPVFDASHDASSDSSSDAGPDGPCPSLAGPAMVPVASFCIDSTEVTIAQYTAFLQAKGGDFSGQPPLCASWNNSLIPAGGLPAGPPDVPIANVNWCMAYMYCQWAGKRLCGSPDGGQGDPSGWVDPARSQWYRACTHNFDGLHNYPYGNSYLPTVCNGADNGADAALPSLVSCEGGYPGIFDMSGNVWEWEDSCGPGGDAGLTGPGDFCNTRGGSFRDNSNALRCDFGIGYTRNSAADSIGIRCCSL